MAERLNVTVGPMPMKWDDNGWSARTLIESDRYLELDKRQSYYACTQHDAKTYDFDGRAIPGGRYLMSPPLIDASNSAFAQYVPLAVRRPTAPLRIGRSIVRAHTNMVFGDYRFPGFRVLHDHDAQDYVGALVRAASLPKVMVKVRNLGGSVGTVGMSWLFDRGLPCVRAHNGKNLYVHSWVNRERFIPEHVTEVYVSERMELDPNTRKYETKQFWNRRDWTPDADLVFHEVERRVNTEPMWTVDVEASVVHGFGETRFAWIQNIETESEDGVPDYDGQYEEMDEIDIINSILSKGAKANLDPTLVLAMEASYLKMLAKGVKKGTGTALNVGPGGSANYLSTDGRWLEEGLNLIKFKKGNVFEATSTILLDPDKAAAQGVSAALQKMLYAPMTAQSDIYRVQYGDPLLRCVNSLLNEARNVNGRRVVVGGMEVEESITLPPRIEKVPVVDELTGEPVGEMMIEVERNPGRAEVNEYQYGPYFMPTATDKQTIVTTAMSANGGKPVLSQRDSVEMVAREAFGADPDDAWARVQAEMEADAQRRASMMGDPGLVGGEVDDLNELPDGAEPV